MIDCPLCGESNLEGADPCEHCGQPMASARPLPSSSDLERQVLGDPLSRLPPRDAPCVAPSLSVGAAIERLASESCGCVVVIEAGRAVGIFSERDVIKRLDLDDDTVRTQPIAALMTPNPETLDEGAPVAFALQRMAGGDYRHIPVTRDGAVVGLISARDILRYIDDHCQSPGGG